MSALSGDDLGVEPLREHVLNELLPLWAQHGRTAERGFVSRLEPDLRPAEDPHLRLLVQARQVFVFSLGYLEGAEFALEIAADTWRFLQRRFLDHTHGGYYLLVDRDGNPADRSKDLYAHAFVLLACAWYLRAAQDPLAGDEAGRLFELLEERLLIGAGAGFAESASQDWTPLAGSRRQNPHMHLFEALLALFESTGEGRYLDAARRILELLRRRMCDVRGCLREHFSAEFAPLAGDEGNLVEPGHHFEWSTLLCQYARLSSDPSALDLAARLFGFAAQYGVDREHGGVYDAIAPDGSLLRDTKRLWPQTEYLRALAARILYYGDASAEETLRAHLGWVRARYLDPATGAWREHAARDGRIVSTQLNATSVYHVANGLLDASLALSVAEG